MEHNVFHPDIFDEGWVKELRRTLTKKGFRPIMDELEVIQIAKVCHEANKAWCEANGDFSQEEWGNAPKNIQDSALAGVKFHLDNPDSSAEASHNEWFLFKQKDGWGYGEQKDSARKTHPCMVPYENLPVVDQKKDFLFKSIVNALK